MWRLSKKRSIYLHENYDASDVVDDCVVLFPFLCGRSDKGIACCFRRVLDEKRPNDFCDLLIFEELPHTITSKDDEFVIRG